MSVTTTPGISAEKRMIEVQDILNKYEIPVTPLTPLLIHDLCVLTLEHEKQAIKELEGEINA